MLLKKETLRGNHARFVSKELTKVNYTRSRFRNRYLKNPNEIKLYNEENCTTKKTVQAAAKQVFLFEENQSNIFFLILQVTG